MSTAIRRTIFVAALCFVSAISWILDHRTEFYMGDSGSYLLTAVQGYIPPDRSFVYGFLIRILSVPFQSLKPLLAAQGIAGLLSCIALLVCLKMHGPSRIPESSYYWVALIFCVEPMHMMLQRYVMTEAFTMPIFVAYMIASLSCIRNPGPGKLVLLQVLGLLLISMRLIFMPLVLANTIVVPLLAQGQAMRKRLLHLAISLACVAALHGGYRALNGKLSHAHPAYTYWDGFVQLSSWAPAVTESCAANPQVAEIIRRGPEYDLNLFSRRYYQLWDREGIVFRIQGAAPDKITANRWARTTAINALLQHPAKVLDTVLNTYLEFNDYNKISYQLYIDRGDDRPVSQNLVMRLQRHFSADSIDFELKDKDYWQKPSLIKSIHQHAGPWVLLLAQTPYICLILGILSKEIRKLCFYLSLVSFIYLATVSFLTPLVVTRLLYPLTVPFFLGIGWFAAATTRTRRPDESQKNL